MWILILIPFLLAEPSTSTSLDLTQAKGLLNTTVKLPCEKPCHGVVKWVKVRSPPSQTIAHCENGTCADFGNKATVGLSGNIFLLLPQAALSDEGGYEGHCDGKVICDVTLELLAHHNTAEVRIGDALFIGLLSSEPVRVTFRKASHSTDDLVCVVEGAVPLCVREYSRRSSVQDYTVTFTNVTESDEGVFTVRDSNTMRRLNIVKLTIKDGLQNKMNEDVGTFKDNVNVPVPDTWQFSIPWEIALFIGGFILNIFLWKILAFGKRTYTRIRNTFSPPPQPEETLGLAPFPGTNRSSIQRMRAEESALGPGPVQTKDVVHSLQ
ncbi:uncharacterized protein LOC116218577 [Clupea harengus]|uniref:Uncharacterized protein LOC116218577 n=1 Tax=Clupea harengus TaxID=7950 RepID=A0A6P8EWE4_CLUHA|nr:uncharacterized protein LOC116218577 [Clupea harengus]